VNLLAGAIAFALATPIVRLIFEHGKFGPDATARVAGVLMALSPGLLFFSAVNILARAFYALDDIKTPMKISIFCLFINLGFALLLVERFREVGLGAANSISAVFNAGLLLYALRKKLSRLEMADLRGHLAKLLGSAVVAGVIAWFAYKWFDGQFGHHGFVIKLGAVFLPMAIGCGVCFGLAMGMRVPYVHDMFAMLPGLRRRKAEPVA